MQTVYQNTFDWLLMWILQFMIQVELKRLLKIVLYATFYTIAVLTKTKQTKNV